MNILYYNNLNTKGVKTQLKKVETALRKGDFKSADVKKIPNTNFYRARLDIRNRLLFQYASFKGESYLLFLEIIHNHQYDKSRFLGGSAIDERKFRPVTTPKRIDNDDIKKLVFINQKQNSFHLLDKIISFDDDQHEVFGLPAPLIIIGSAGSGKTALTLEKMKHFRGNVVYISLSPYLVENAQKIYYSFGYDNSKQDIDFLSFKDYIESIKLPKGQEIHFKDFEHWYARYRQATKIKEDYKLFEEFKGVLTGSVIDKPYLSREDYLNLGVKQSIFLKKEREKVYDIFEKYLKFLNEGRFYDSNIVSFQHRERVIPKYDFVVVDEVQDLTNVQLMLILKSLKSPTNFLLSGDSNQIVHPNFFSWSKLKTMFFKTDLRGSLIRILKTNYRNSAKITELSNTLLKVKNARFGSIDKESTYLINTVSESEGEINFFEDNDKIKKTLNSKTEKSTKFAVLVMNNEEKGRVRKYFKTPLIFSIQEAKGLEYENIILVNFISNYDKEFREITRDVTVEDLTDDLRYSRAKNKENKELEAYKFYINSLYVAFTRAVKNIYIVEAKKKQPILTLLGIRKTQAKLELDNQESDAEDWLKEAERLELQGKYEQAQQIRDKLKGIEYISPEEVEILKVKAFNTSSPNKQARKRLFKFAVARFNMEIVERLANINYYPAVDYRRELRKDLKSYVRDIRNNKTKSLERYIQKYHVDVQNPGELMTGLMLAITNGATNSFEFFMAKKASILLKNAEQLVPIQLAIRAYDREKLSLPKLQRIYPRLKMPNIKCKTSERVLKVHDKSMEYFLLHYLIAVRDDLIDPKDPPKMQGLTMDEFMEYIEEMPDNILPPYRRKRQYVNSILAKNEVNRDDVYNKKLFKRKSRGCYNLNPDLVLIYE